MGKHRGSVKIKRQVTSIFLVLTLLFSCFSQFALGYAEGKYERHVAFRNEPVKKEIKVGETLDIYAMVVDDEGTEDTYWDDLDGDTPNYTEYKWSSKDESVATAKADGEYYQELGHIKGVSAGKVKITVESTACENCEPKEIEITVIEDKPKYERHVAFRNESVKREIKVGETLDIYAMVVDDEGTEDTYWDDLDGDTPNYTEYKWSSKDESVATAKADGEYYQDLGHIKGVSAGKVKITVESTACDNCEPKEIEITVIDDKPKYERHVDFRHKEKIKKEIKVGEILDIYAMVVDDKGIEDTYYDGWDDVANYTKYKWSSKDEDIVTAEADDEDFQELGHITGISSGTVKVTVESKDCENCEPKEIEITVIEDKPVCEKGEIDNIKISLNKDIEEIESGRKIKLNVIAKDSTNKEIDNPNVKWEIEPKDSAVIDNDILSALKEGNITVKATAEKSDKSVVESNSVSIKVIKPKSREEKIDEAIDTLIAKYKNPTFYGLDGLSDKYTDKLALALRHSGMDIEEINKTKRIFSTEPGYYSMLNTSRNIMTLIAANEDPKKEVEKILDNSFTFYKDEDKDGYTEKLVNAIIALDMTGADYKKEASVKALINESVKNGDNVYFESYGNADAELTAKALIAFSKHKDINGVTDTIDGIKKYLKSIQSESGLIESCSITCEVIQAIIALGQDPLDEYWVMEDEYGNKNNMVDAALVCIKEQILPMIRPSEQTHAAMAALTDLKNKKSMYNELKYIKVGAPSRIKINNEAPISIVEGDKLEIKASVYDKDNNQIKNSDIIWESLDKSKAIVENGIITALNEGNVNIKVSLKDKPKISDQISINIKSGISDEVLKEKVKKEIEFLKDHYEAYNQYEFVASPAAIISGIDKSKVQNKIQKYSRYTSSYQYAKLIISSLGAELDPRDIEIERKIKNSVDILRASQVKDGENKGQFIINNYMDANSIEALGYSIIALDMANADYDKEGAIKALINLLKDPDLKTKLRQDEVKIKAVALTAFANHKNIEGVTEQIESIITLLKEKQNEDAGFGSKQGNNSPITTSRVVQALVANGINPLYSKEWMKNKKTMLDSILKNKYEHPTDISKSGFSKFEGGSRNYEATYYAFAALTDMYENESMFEKFKVKDKVTTKVGDVTKVSIVKPNNNKMLIGKTIKLYANAWDDKYNLAEDANIVWKVSDDKASIDENGILTAKKVGTVNVTAHIQDKDIEDTIDIIIENIGVNEIRIHGTNKIRVKEQIELNANIDEGYIRLGAKAYDTIGNEIKDMEFVWTSSDESIVDIAMSHGSTYIRALKEGSVDLKASLKDNPDINDTMKLEVLQKTKAKVKVRVEGLVETIVPETEIEVENFDLGGYGDKSCMLKEQPTAMNALIDALKHNGINCNDKNKFDAGSKLTRVINIDGIKELEHGPNSGWMYFVNNKYVDKNLIDKEIKDNDSITVIYFKDYKKEKYSYFDKTKVVVKANQSFTINYKANIKNDIGKYIGTNIENAQILVNKERYMLDGKDVLTDSNGNATLRFEKEGEYILQGGSTNPKVDYIGSCCKVIVTNDVKEEKFEVNVADTNISYGEEARLNINIKNNATDERMLICIIALDDENGKILKYSSIIESIDGNGEKTISPQFAIPDSGKYKIKVFVADNEENIDQLNPVKIIDIN